jgi:hypothetical protein
LANGFKGSGNLQISTANNQVIPPPEVGWTIPYIFNKFSFLNDQECHISINQQPFIYFRSGQGFNSDRDDQPITSFVIQEEGITFNWVGSW